MAAVLDPPRPRPPLTPAPGRGRGRRGSWLLVAAVRNCARSCRAARPAPATLHVRWGPPGRPGVSIPTGAARDPCSPRRCRCNPGRWYRVGATNYGGADGSEAAPDLPAYPDSFAELSLLDTNPYPNFTFADAQRAREPALRHRDPSPQRQPPEGADQARRRVRAGARPGDRRIGSTSTARSRRTLQVTKNPVKIELAPASGTGATLGQLPSATAPAGASAGGCPPGPEGPLVLTPGPTAKILSDGSAAAPTDAPGAVKLAIAAGNQIDTKPYPVPAVHYGPLTQMWPAYDCSGAVSYVLYRAGLHSAYPDVSGNARELGQVRARQLDHRVRQQPAHLDRHRRDRV